MAVTFASPNTYARTISLRPEKSATGATGPLGKGTENSPPAPAPTLKPLSPNHALTNQRNFFAVHQRRGRNRDTGAGANAGGDARAAHDATGLTGARLSGPVDLPHIPDSRHDASSRPADARQASTSNKEPAQPATSATVGGPADIPHIPEFKQESTSRPEARSTAATSSKDSGQPVASATLGGPADVPHVPVFAERSEKSPVRPREPVRRGPPPPYSSIAQPPAYSERPSAAGPHADEPLPLYSRLPSKGERLLPRDTALVYNEVSGRASFPGGAALLARSGPAAGATSPGANMRYTRAPRPRSRSFFKNFGGWRKDRSLKTREQKFRASQDQLERIRSTPVTHEVRVKAKGHPAKRIRFQITGQQIQDFMTHQSAMFPGASTNPAERNQQLIAFLEKQNVPFQMSIRGGSPTTMPQGLASQFIANQQQAPALQSVWDQYRAMQFLMTMRAPTRQL